MTERLLIGGAGFIGSTLARLLAESGPLRVLDNLSTGRASNLDGIEGVELMIGSVLEPDTLEAALEGVRTVYHLAALGVRQSIHSPLANHEVNASGTLHVLEAARRRGIERFVYTSTSEVYGTARSVPMREDHPTFPHTVYGAAKLAAEAYVRAYSITYGLPTVILRPFNAFGPRSHHEGDSGEVIPRFLTRAMNGLPPVIFGDGSQTRDFTFVEDTARAIAAAGAAEGVVGATLNVASGKEVAISQLGRLVLEAVGRQELGVSYVSSRPGDVHRLMGDATKIRQELGWEPTTSLVDGLRKLLDWHKQNETDWAAALAEETERNWDKGELAAIPSRQVLIPPESLT
jgi:UDP-glucose 4-epimerase